MKGGTGKSGGRRGYGKDVIYKRRIKNLQSY